MFIDISCRCGNIFFIQHNILNKYYYAMNVCPSLCMQRCYLDPFCMVKEEKKCESHDTLAKVCPLFYFSYFYNNVSLVLVSPPNSCNPVMHIIIIDK